MVDTQTVPDLPKSLKTPEAREARHSKLREPHIRVLTEFVEQIRRETGQGLAIPFFDPLDGGTNAVCLFLGEAPGPKAVESGFVSRNNPDESAKNFFELNRLARIPRIKTVIWNIVPWYIGSGVKIRPATSEDIRQGENYLFKLLPLLPSVSVIVLSGNKAQAAEAFIRKINSKLEIVRMMHTSPLVINTNKENRKRILEQLKLVRDLIAS